MNTIDGIIEDLELEDSCVGGCTTKGEIIECLENLKILQKEKETVVKVLKDVKADVEDIDGITEIGAQILDEVLGIIDRKIKEIKHECSACTHSDEVDGEHCYECVKGDRDNFEAVAGEELTNPFGDNSKIFGG